MNNDENNALKSLANLKPREHLFDIELVKAELENAVAQLANLKVVVSIFGSARIKENDPDYQLALSIAKTLSEHGISIITGGGPGVMEAANHGCKLGTKGLSIGLNIRLPREQFPNSYQDLSLSFDHFLTRKTGFMAYSDAFICLPGGFGTLDELFEAITLIQTKKMIAKPIILVNKTFWMPLITWFRTNLLERKLIEEKDIDRIILVDSEEELIIQLASSLTTE